MNKEGELQRASDRESFGEEKQEKKRGRIKNKERERAQKEKKTEKQSSLRGGSVSKRKK